MTIGDIFTSFPQKSQLLAQAMTQAGLHCTSCSAATWETLEAGMFGHGMAQAAIDQLVQKLNKIVEEELPPSSEQAYSIVLTPKAAHKFREFAREEGVENPSLRFGDTAGGCSGFQYVLDFSEGAEEKDAIFHSEGIEIHIKKGMLPRLTGCVIDYVDALQGAGFKISNPNVKSACACGTSQGY
jgi:iron-sulfur cluster assembly accessory protein